MSDQLSLERKLKEAMIRRLTETQHKDRPYMVKGRETYTRQQIADEIEAESNFGIEMMTMMLALALQLTNESKEF